MRWNASRSSSGITSSIDDNMSAVMPTSPDVMIANYRNSAGSGVCSECGFDWSLTPEQAHEIVTPAPTRYGSLLHSRLKLATRKPAPEIWSPSAYVWHVADAIGIWAERLKGILGDSHSAIVPFDQDELAEVRGYEQLSPLVGLWALERRAGDWRAVLEEAGLKDVDFVHPEFGPWSVRRLLRYIAHEVSHHELDIKRGLGLA